MRSQQNGLEKLFRLNYEEIWAAVYRSRLAVFAIFFACLLLALIVTILSTTVYKAAATVQINQEATKVLGTEQDNAAAVGALDSQRFLNTELEVLRSRAVATLVANELKLFNNPEFLEVMGVDPEFETPAGGDPAEANRRVVLGLLARNLSVAFESDSRIATIEFSSPDPNLAARIANSFADNYIRNNLQRKFDTSSYARNFLKGQLEQAQSRLERAERALVDFSASTKIIDASNAAETGSGAPRSLVTASLVDLNNELSKVTAHRVEAQQRWEQARKTAVMDLPEVLTNNAVQQLVEERARYSAEYEEQLKRRRDDYPVVQQTKAKIDEIDRHLSRLAGAIRSSIRNEFVVAQRQERVLAERLEDLKRDTLDEQSNGVQLSVLRREADTTRQQFEALLRRYNQLNAEAGVQTNNIAIIDRAVPPSDPSWPKIPLNAALALLAGALLSCAYILVREQLLERIRMPDDVLNRLNLSLLGTVPDVGEHAIEGLADPKSQISEAFSSVRTSIMFSSKNGLPRSMTFVSTGKGEGKSTTCFATAVGLGKLGRRVLVLDLDLRLPMQHTLHGLDNATGMTEILAAGLDPMACIRATGQENVSLISSGAVPPNPTELLSGERLGQVVDQMLSEYDVVMIDSPPVLGLADALLIASNVEAVIYVVRSGVHSPKSVQGALRRLRQGTVTIVGGVLTRFNAGRLGYGEEQSYSYHY